MTWGFTIQNWVIGISWNFLSPLKSLLNSRSQKVVLNDLCLNCSSVLAGVLQDSVLRPWTFLIYINVLPNGLESTNKLFADDGSLFSTVYDPNMSAYQLDKDLKKLFQNGNTNWKWSALQT